MMNTDKIKSLYQFFKPGLALNIVITEIPVFIHYRIESFEIILYTTLGTFLCAMSSFAYNQILEQKKDSLMERTKHRYLVQYQDLSKKIFILSSSLIGLGILILGYNINFYAMLFALFAFLNYIFIYTIWLKPRYTFNTIIGGLSGSIGPLIAESAIMEKITEYSIFLFILLFLWQPPHFWTLSIFRLEDYKKADFAMLPVVKGIDYTTKQIYFYLILFLLFILLGNILDLVGLIFSIPTFLFTMYIFYKVWLFQKSKDTKLMRETFFLSIFLNIFWHFVLIIEELLK